MTRTARSRGSTCSYSCCSYSEFSRDGATTKMSNPHVPEHDETDPESERHTGMQDKNWFFDVTFKSGKIVRDVRVAAPDLDTAYDRLYVCDEIPVEEIAHTHLQHTRNGKTRRV